MHDSAPATIILVEDDTALSEALGVLLGAAGYRHRSFVTAEDFFASELPAPPRCVISDYRLPGISGIELQRRIAQRAHHIPVLLLSADISESDADQALVNGMFAVMRKPFDPEDLLELAAAALDASGRGPCIAKTPH